MHLIKEIFAVILVSNGEVPSLNVLDQSIPNLIIVSQFSGADRRSLGVASR